MGLEKFLRFFDHKRDVLNAKETLVFAVQSRLEVAERFKSESYLRFGKIMKNGYSAFGKRFLKIINMMGL